MGISVAPYIKFEVNLEYEAIFNCAIPYLVALMIIGIEFLEDPENNLINPWPEGNTIVLDKIIMEVWNKWALKLGYRKNQWD